MTERLEELWDIHISPRLIELRASLNALQFNEYIAELSSQITPY